MSAPRPFREKLNSRKLLVFLLSFSTATGLLAAGLIQADHWVTVTITTAGAYMATQAWVDKDEK